MRNQHAARQHKANCHNQLFKTFRKLPGEPRGVYPVEQMQPETTIRNQDENENDQRLRMHPESNRFGRVLIQNQFNHIEQLRQLKRLVQDSLGMQSGFSSFDNGVAGIPTESLHQGHWYRVGNFH